MEKNYFRVDTIKGKNNYFFLYDSISEGLSKNFSRHVHNFFEIIYIKKGAGVYGTEKYYTNFKSNSLIITPAQNYHFLLINREDKYERFSIHTTNPELNNLLAKSLTNITGVLNVQTNQFLTAFFDSIYAFIYDAKNKLNKEVFENYLCSKIQELYVYLSTLSSDTFKLQSKNYPPVLSSIIEFITENLASVSVNVVSKKFNISNTYLNKLFNNYLQSSPSNFILSKRLAFANELIKEGIKLSVVATTCGFSDYSTFYRSYKKYFGFNPSNNIV